jgi:hypothetical protein
MQPPLALCTSNRFATLFLELWPLGRFQSVFQGVAEERMGPSRQPEPEFRADRTGRAR